MNALSRSDSNPDSAAAFAGTPLDAGVSAAREDDVIEALRTVYDPEIPVNIYDLGLIYRLSVGEDGSVDIDMTLTAPSCPVAGTIPQEVADRVASVPGVGEVTVSLVWEPPWSMEHLSEEARLTLNLY